MKEQKIRRFISLDYIFPNNSKNIIRKHILLTRIINLILRYFKTLKLKKKFTFFQHFWKSRRKSRCKGRILEGLRVYFKNCWTKITLFRYAIDLRGSASNNKVSYGNCPAILNEALIPSHCKYTFHQNNSLERRWETH